MVMAAVEDGEKFEWNERELDSFAYVCPVKLVVELDPDMTETLTYAFTKEGLSGLRDTLVLTTEDLHGWSTLPTLRESPRGKNPLLPLHPDLVHALGGAEAGGGETAYVNGKAPCKICSKEVTMVRMRLHVGGHILRDEVRCSS